MRGVDYRGRVARVWLAFFIVGYLDLKTGGQGMGGNKSLRLW